MAPNPIDFDKVFTEFDRLPETGNVAVIIAVSCVFGFYLLLLVWARKADKKDSLKVGTAPYVHRNECVLLVYSNECFFLRMLITHSILKMNLFLSSKVTSLFTYHYSR